MLKDRFLKIFKKLFLSFKNLSTRNKVIGAFAMLVLVVTIIVPMTGTSYAAYTDWRGYTTSSSYSTERGFTSGTFAVHLGKNGQKYASVTVTVTPTSVTASNNTNALFKELRNNAKKYKFSNSGENPGDTDLIQVGASPTTTYTASKTAITGGTANYYAYVKPSIKVVAPKGYKYTSTGSGIAYDTSLFDVTTAMAPYIGTSTSTSLMPNTPGPYANDTTITGYMNLSIRTPGLVTRETDSTHNYRARQSYNINFVPNTTTVHYNANGGTGTMEDQTQTYDTALTLRNNTFTKTGYKFVGWNTEADGSGTSYGSSTSGGTVAATAWPTPASTPSGTNEVTLYAQWQGEKYTATFYYQSNSTNGETSTSKTTAQCTVSSGTNCSVTIPTAVRNSVGTYNNAYAGLANSTATMNTTVSSSTTTITLSSSATYYATYSTPVNVYTPTSTSATSSTTLYRNQWLSSTSAMATTVLASSATGTTDATHSPSVSGYTFQGYANAASTNTVTYSNLAALKNSNATSAYSVFKKDETVTATFYYNNNTNCGGTTVASTTASGTKTTYLRPTSTTAAGTSVTNGTISVPGAVSGSKGPYNGIYVGVASGTSSMTAATVNTATTTYYAFYRNNVKINYPSSTSATTNKTVYRNEFFTSTSAISTVLSATNTGTTTNATAGLAVSGYSTLIGFNTAANQSTATSGLTTIDGLRQSCQTEVYEIDQKSETVTATFYYNSNSTCGSLTASTATASGTKTTKLYPTSASAATTSASNGSITVPSAVSSSNGKFGGTYIGVASSTNSMTAATVNTATTTYYAFYRTGTSSPGVTLYYPTSESAVGNTKYYRNEFFTSTTAINAVLNTSNTGTSNYTHSSSVSGYSLYGFRATPSNTTRTYNTVADLAASCTTTAYAIDYMPVTVTFYYSNSAAGARASTTATDNRYLVCDSATSAAEVNSGLGVTLTDEVAPYGTSANGWYSSANTMSTRTPHTGNTTYYRNYSKPVTLYYYNGSSYTNTTMYRNSYLASSSATTYTTVLATSNTGLTNYSTAAGPGSSTWYGLSTAQDTTREYSSVDAAAKSTSTTLYTVYQFGINYAKGSNVSAIEKTSDSCLVTTSNTSCNVTLPSITANTGYTSVGWGTSSGATTGTAAGTTYSVSTNNQTLYANAQGNTYTATFYYQSNSTSGSTTVTSTSVQCTVSSGSSCSVTIPSAVRSSVGTYNNAYAGLSSSTGNMTEAVASSTTSLTLTGNITRYAIYRTQVDIYKPTGLSECLKSTRYRNQWLASTSTMATTVLSLSTTGTTDATSYTSSVSGYSFYGFATSASTNSRSFTDISDLKQSTQTTVYEIDKKDETITATFYYSNSTAGAKTSTTASGTRTTYLRCTSTSVAGTSVVEGTISPTLSDEVAPYGTTANGWSTSKNSMSTTSATTANTTYYRNYSKAVTLYYYNGSSYTNTTMYRNSYLNSSLYTTVLASSNTGTSNYSTANGPGSSAWYGLSTAKDTTREYSSVDDAAKSTSTTLYTVYQFTVTFNKNGNTRQTLSDGTVATVTTVTQSCFVTTSSTSCNITSPTIGAPSNTPTVVGYNTSSSGTTSEWNQNTSKAVSANATYYAITTKAAVTHTATFYKNGASKQTNASGTAVTDNTVTRTCTIAATYNGTAQATTCSITSPTITAATGFSVVGYNTSSSATTSTWSHNTAKTDISGDVTYYAITKSSDAITITFNKNGATSQTPSGGSASTATTVTASCYRYNGASSCSVTSPAITRSGFTITGYNTSSTATTSSWNVSTAKSVSENATYYAITSKSVTITFNKNGNTSQTPSGGSASTNNTVTQSCTIQNSATTCNITSPTIGAPSNTPTVVGYNTSSSGTTSEWNQNTSKAVDANATYYAITKKDAVTRKVKFFKNGNTSFTYNQTKYTSDTEFDLCTIAATYNGTAQATSCSATITMPTLEAASGFTTKGWHTSSAGTASPTYTSGQTNVSLTSSGTLNLYGQSQKAAVTHAAIFHKNGASKQTNASGTAVTDNTVTRTCTIAATYNGTAQAATCSITSPTITAATGFSVVGYNTSSSATTSTWSHNTAKTDISSNVTYYAITKSSDAITITFNKNGATSQTPSGGSASTNNTVTASCYRYNGASTCNVTSPAITRSGFTITGYNTSSSGTTSEWNQNTSKAVEANATYYAITSKSVTITFNKNGNLGQTPSGGSYTTSSTVTQSCTIQNSATTCNITSPTIYVYDAYEVVGYNTSSSGTTSEWNQNTSKAVNSNATYFAISKPSTYTLTAHANGGTIPQTTGWTGSGNTATKQVTYGDSIGTLPVPTRTGYVFDGWNASEDGSGVMFNDGKYYYNTFDTNVYAQWYYGIGKGYSGDCSWTIDHNGKLSIFAPVDDNILQSVKSKSNGVSTKDVVTGDSSCQLYPDDYDDSLDEEVFPWYSYKNDITSVEIGEGVFAAYNSKNMFKDLRNVETIDAGNLVMTTSYLSTNMFENIGANLNGGTKLILNGTFANTCTDSYTYGSGVMINNVEVSQCDPFASLPWNYYAKDSNGTLGNTLYNKSSIESQLSSGTIQYERLYDGNDNPAKFINNNLNSNWKIVDENEDIACTFTNGVCDVTTSPYQTTYLYNQTTGEKYYLYHGEWDYSDNKYTTTYYYNASEAFVPAYTITYDKGSGSSVSGTPNPKAYRIGTDVNTSGYSATKAKNTFNNWNTVSNGSGTTLAKNAQTNVSFGDKYSTTGLTNGNVTVYAQYTPNYFTPGITKTISNEKSLYKTGDTITYSIKVTNNESTAITNVVVSDPNATITSGTGYTVNNTHQATISSIAAGGSVTINATRTITTSDVNTITNKATITSATNANAILTTSEVSASKTSNVQSLIKITKTVQGNMADTGDYFKVKVNIGGTTGHKYTISGQSYTGTGKQTTYTVGSTNYIWLKHGETITIGDGASDNKILPGTTYSVEETTDYPYTYINGSSTNNKSSGNLTTSTTNNTNTVSILNSKEIPVSTGINKKYTPYIIIVTVVLIGGLLVVIRSFKRKLKSSDIDTNY